jgi:hypothetical protein
MAACDYKESVVADFGSHCGSGFHIVGVIVVGTPRCGVRAAKEIAMTSNNDPASFISRTAQPAIPTV